ncbi:MAG: hypothetical protein OXG15_01765 [Gammaproteobacteria bacterium]|nr:hypothetical protein [Gammaproteobacteria bacterium]
MSETALDAYWRFFETFNTRDAYSFSSAMSYPHVRVSWARQPVVLADHEAHALSVSWDAFIRSGWDHTVGADPELIGSSDSKAHISGGWTRFTASDEPILVNRVCYIATRAEGRWGIQSRFGTDPGNEGNEQKRSESDVALECAKGFLQAAENDVDAIGQYTTDEFLVIGVGAVRRVNRGDDPAVKGMREPQLRVVQSGPSSVTANAVDGDHSALIYTVQNDGKWRAKAGSWL